MFFGKSRLSKYTPSSGFTLAEILVVITIIGILVSALTISGSTYLRKGRDASRLVAVTDISKAIFIYSTVQGYFPPANIDGCYPADILMNANYLKKALLSPSGKNYDEGCGPSGMYAYGSNGYLMLLMSKMEMPNGGNYTGSTLGFTGNLSPLGYYNAYIGMKKGAGSMYLSVLAGGSPLGGSGSSGSGGWAGVDLGGPPPPATPTNGTCGGANGVATYNEPTINKCGNGVPSTVITGTGTYTWSCFGTDGGTNTSCSAPRQYNMIFDGNGGTGQSPTSKLVSAGTAIGTLPTAPTMSGYSFTGWYTMPAGGTGITISTLINTDTTAYAQWVVEPPSFKSTWATGATVQFSYTSSGGITVDWGDGIKMIYPGGNGTLSHTIGSTRQLKVYGDLRRFWNQYNYIVYPIISVDDWGGMKWDSMQNMFYYANNLITIPTTSPDMTNVASLNSTFEGAESFNDADLGNWNVGNATNMGRMFYAASAYNQPLNSWNVGNVTNMDGMFNSASNFNQPLNNWNVSKVTDMGSMFAYAGNFNQPIGNWNVSKVTDMSYMFGCAVYNGGWQCPNNSASNFNQDISTWNVGNVTDMSYMFTASRVFNQRVDSWDVSNVTNMRMMFSSYGFNNGGYSLSWGSRTRNVTNMSNMFWFSSSFNQDISSWDLSSVIDMSWMFYGVGAFNNGGQPLNWGSKTRNVKNMGVMFGGAWPFGRAPVSPQDLSGWDVSSVTNCNQFNWQSSGGGANMIAPNFNGCGSIY